MAKPTCSVPNCDRPAPTSRWCGGHNRPRGVSLREAFEYFMGTEPPASGCWDWVGNTTHGYGLLPFEYKTLRAHRVSYELFVGSIPDGLLIRHTCDRPICVQPAHLIPGTVAQNSQDARDRNRTLTGERHNMAKLTEDDVLEIRRLHVQTDMTREEIGKRFGVTLHSVTRIVGRLSWRHLPPAEGEGVSFRTRTKTKLEVLEENTDGPRPDDGCWLWTGKLDMDSAPRMNFENKSLTARREAYKLFVGELPKGRHVRTTCGDPTCVQPLHLALGRQPKVR